MLLWLLHSLICVVSLRNNYFGRGFINKLQLQTNIIHSNQVFHLENLDQCGFLFFLSFFIF